MDQDTSKVILYLNCSLASGKNNEYSIAVGIDFSRIKNFFRNILLKTARLCDVWLQNYGAINCVVFWTTLYVYRA